VTPESFYQVCAVYVLSSLSEPLASKGPQTDMTENVAIFTAYVLK